eukprot:11879027-Ditylum_brightwellii.AAC.1
MDRMEQLLVPHFWPTKKVVFAMGGHEFGTLFHKQSYQCMNILYNGITMPSTNKLDNVVISVAEDQGHSTSCMKSCNSTILGLQTTIGAKRLAGKAKCCGNTAGSYCAPLPVLFAGIQKSAVSDMVRSKVHDSAAFSSKWSYC